MKKKLDLDTLYNLSYLIRYSNVPRIKDESVAEHSFYVALSVIKLYEDYNFNLQRAISMAVTHDLVESEIGDISFMLKRKNPVIKEEIKVVEYVEIAKYPDYVRELIEEYMDMATIESIIVHIADAHQCYCYANHEVKLGNAGYMQNVVDNVPGRVDELKTLIQHVER